jgi:F-type H+-transporting ATPase subunit alpha
MIPSTNRVIEGEIGFVIKAKGYLLTLEGLPSARVNTVIVNAAGQRALVTAFREDRVEAYLLDRGNPRAGDQFVIHPQGIQYAIGAHLFGRAINVLGEPIDGQGDFPPGSVPLRMEAQAPSMSYRAQLVAPLFTGMPAVDILIPIAKGQRQLIVGPVSSGKRAFVEGVFAHQKDSAVVCIYAFIGRPVAYVEGVVAHLRSEQGNKNAIILVSFSDDPAPMVYLTPIVALEIAEAFSLEGKDVLLVLDDLGNHAKYFREITLLSGRVPGRESYPGDMFYQQARLLERGGRFNKSLGGGSITILPILETNIEDLTSLVSTNLVSATDGHLFFSPLFHAEGHFPAVTPEQSITRVGRSTQNKLAKQLSIRVNALLAQYERQRRYAQFGTQLSEETRHVIAQGEAMRVFLDQEPMTVIPLEVQVVLLALVFSSLLDNKDVTFAKQYRDTLIATIDKGTEYESIKGSVERGNISLEQFQKKLESIVPLLETVCRPV